MISEKKTLMSFLAHVDQGPSEVLLSVFIHRYHLIFLFVSHKPLTKLEQNLLETLLGGSQHII